jgi:Peptidase A4 family
MMRLWLIGVLTTAVASVFAPAALADTTNSSNWAGYAVHRSGISFKTVTGGWRQPTVRCTAGTPSYSAFWVGLGGYSLNSPALEQTGTEVDCTPGGKAVSSVWYELVPAPSMPIRLDVRPGDLVRASVTTAGTLVTISLDDVTRHRGFHKTVNSPTIDASSAEWIVEAPSECVSAGSCQTLPLARFAPTLFGSASAQTTAGHTGSISDPIWSWTRITLTPDGHRFSTYGGRGPFAPAASPTALLSKGTAFKVDYALVSTPGSPGLRVRTASVRSRPLVHPRR